MRGSRDFCQSYLVLSLFYSLQRGSNGFIAEKTILILYQGSRGDQESIQSSTTPDPGYQWESNKLTVRHHRRELRSQDNLQIYYSSASATVLSKGTEPR